MRAAGVLVMLLAGLTTGLPLRADRLLLENGRAIDVARWWYDGDWVRYESLGGTIAVPRSMVLRVEGSQASAEALSAGSAAGRSRGPRSAELLDTLQQGSAALERRDFEAASTLFFSAVQIDPDLYDARVGYAIAELALGRYGLAQSVILDGVEREPERPELHELLGDLHDREERVEEALRAWREAFRLGPTDGLRTKIFKGERELRASGNYDYSASSHFTLRYDGEVDLALAASVLEHLEAEYWTLTDRFAHAPLQPITVLLYPTRDFREVTQAPEWVGGLYDGKIRVPLGGLNRLDARAKGVLTHELTHAVLHGKTRGNCPRWLHEGLAQFSEGRQTNPAELTPLRAALLDVVPARWEDEVFSYPLALALTEYLLSRRGFDDLVVLLDRLGEGQTLDGALQAVYGVDYATLCRLWVDALAAQERR